MDDRLKNIVTEIVDSITGRCDVGRLASTINIDMIPVEDLQKQYIDYSLVEKTIRFSNNLIKEDINATLSIDETKEQIQKRFKLKDWQFTSCEGANGVQLIMLCPNIFKNVKLIEKEMLKCGWTISSKETIFRHKMLWNFLAFDPMFQDDISNEVRRYRYLYHWTPLYNYQSIKNNGLQPKSENSKYTYPNRIHFLKGNIAVNDLYNIGEQLFLANKNRNNDGNYVLLKIDVSKIPEQIEFYYDPHYYEGYYIIEQIPPDCLEPVIGINFKTQQKFSV